MPDGDGYLRNRVAGLQALARANGVPFSFYDGVDQLESALAAAGVPGASPVAGGTVFAGTLAVGANASASVALEVGRLAFLVAFSLADGSGNPAGGTADVHGRADLSDRPQATFVADGTAGTAYRGPAVAVGNDDSPRVPRVYLKLTNPSGSARTYAYSLTALRLEA